MNKGGLTKPSNRVVVTDANALPKNVGFPGNMAGKTRSLNRTELAIQKAIMNHSNVEIDEDLRGEYESTYLYYYKGNNPMSIEQWIANHK